MWNWYVTSLATGAAVVCYDGSPLTPNKNIMWDLIDKFGYVLSFIAYIILYRIANFAFVLFIRVTTLGTGAKWISVLEENNIRPREHGILWEIYLLYAINRVWLCTMYTIARMGC